MNCRQLLQVLVLGASVSAPGLALAADSEMAAELGAGGASRADLGSLAAIATAPGILHLRPRFDLGGGFAYGTGNARKWQVAATDSQTGPVALGVMFSRTSEESEVRDEDLPGWKEEDLVIGERREIRQRVGGAIATSFLNRTIGVGASLAYLYRKDGFDRTDGAIGVGASAGLRAGEQFVLSVTGDNLLPTGLWFAPTTFATGARLDVSPAAALQGDLILDFTSLANEVAIGARVGAEFTVGGIVPLRVGWARFGALDENRLTAGIGVGNEQAAVDYAFQGTLATDGQPFEQWHGISVRLSI